LRCAPQRQGYDLAYLSSCKNSLAGMQAQIVANYRINSDSETIFRRFRNQISAIPQPKSDTLPQPKKALPQPKKNRFRNQK
jgi:hypothetical protein